MNPSRPDLETDVDLGFTHRSFPRATHMCYLYNDEQERRKVISQFINAGLEHHEFVGYFADVPHAAEVTDYLLELGVNIPPDLTTDRYLFQTAKATYCPHNHFRVATMLANLRTLHHNCCQRGMDCIRVSGEMSWAASPDVQGVEGLVEYEARVNLLLETHPLVAICQYDATAFDGETLFEILQVHPMMVVRGQVVHNPYYVPVREYLLERGLSLAQI